MAQNTYKNTIKKPEVPKEEKERVNPLSRLDFSFIKEPKFKSSVGIGIMLTSFAVLAALVSALFTGKADQSVVESFWESAIRDSGQEAQNWLKLTGAIMSHFLMYKSFGICSFFVPPLLFAVGYRVTFTRRLFNLTRLSSFALFTTLWFGSLVGYIILLSEAETTFGWISGGIGYEIASFFHDMIGWGTWLLLAFSGLLFLLYFFDMEIPSGKPSEAKPESKPIAKPIITSQIPLQVEDEEELEVEIPVANKPIITAEKEPVIAEPIKTTEKQVPEFKIVAPVVEKKPEPEFAINTSNIPPIIPFPEDENSEEAALVLAGKPYDPTLDLPHYQYPPSSLLNDYGGGGIVINSDELSANKDKIVDTLNQYKIDIEAITATVGPSVTLYEIVPAKGVRIANITRLENDIALSLAALGIRMIAPIPGKGAIGIEVPNKNREMVSMRSVLENERFMQSTQELPIILGKTISNEALIMDLAKMPHLLMAGATGQGKSVGLNVLLTSLLYRKHPSQLKLVLVDPKKVELSLFAKIERHFLASLPDAGEAIITDTQKVVHTLNSLCKEMDTRYDLLKDANCRNLREYNAKFVERKLNPEKGHKFMPYIVLVIDELADLMMTAGKEVEQPIARLAQLARAIGIHLVVATQRPSVNVITGIIKANFPARLSFRVTSKVDSRTILDTSGAEQLVGQGDMLFSQGSDLIRLQCPFVDTPEIEKICEFIGAQRGYDSAYMLPEIETEDGIDKGSVDLSQRDPMFEEAARTIVLSQQGSTSLIQRKLSLGYNRAGRIIDQLEAAGIVGPFEGSKAREVLIKDEYSLEMLLKRINEKN